MRLLASLGHYVATRDAAGLQITSQWQLLMAAATMVIGLAVIFFFVAQRYFVQGITLTGIKG